MLVLALMAVGPRLTAFGIKMDDSVRAFGSLSRPRVSGVF